MSLHVCNMCKIGLAQPSHAVCLNYFLQRRLNKGLWLLESESSCGVCILKLLKNTDGRSSGQCDGMLLQDSVTALLINLFFTM